ncbi:MAG: transcription elongation factor GreAB [Microvirga sp.]|jgi:transcription elongation GreA/GreB family factor|nr:transcription elongation factor GreAB [Microvirga sp.]
MNMRAGLPPIIIGTKDFNRLVSAAALQRTRTMPNRNFLISELRRASICDQNDLPGEVVSVRSRVTYRLGRKGRRVLQDLVFPEDLTSPQSEVSVTTALGIALLGLRSGDWMPFSARPNEVPLEVMVEDVASLPSGGEPERGEPLSGGENSMHNLDRRLDDALAETFPASDPVSVSIA